MEIGICPTTDQIMQLLNGEVSGPLAAQLKEHLKNCDRCVESLQRSAAFTDNSSPAHANPQAELLSHTENETVIVSTLQYAGLAFLSKAERPDEIGRLAHYRVLRVLGEGGMGMVLQAEDTQLERPVALKVIREEYRKDSEVEQRFLREARAMAKVKNDHVVTIHQVGEYNHVGYIAMELLEGAPLEELMETHTLPPLRETVRIAREIATALAAAHVQGLIHRDIKPENVWLEAPTGRVKLLDFGLARPQQVSTKLTSSGMIMGTPAYMSPEQARATDVDSRTDLFSLGCLLHALIVGDPPFLRGTVLDTLTALAIETPFPVSQWNPNCPPQLVKLISRLLAKEPGQRPASAQEVIAELDAIDDLLSSDSASASSTARPAPPRDSQRRQKASAHPNEPVGATATHRSQCRKSERRQLTVVVCGCELFEAEEFLENMEMDEQHQVLRSFETICSDAVLKLSGTIVQCNQESLIACFGYPSAQEDAAHLAAEAALAIREALKELAVKLRLEHQFELGAWIAVHTGSAIVATEGETITLGGEARSVAMRLKDSATTGQIILSESTHKVLRGEFECQSLGHQKIKGLEQPIELFQLQAALEDKRQQADSGEIELTPLTGRDLEMNLLKDRWEQAQEGVGQVVLLIGEAGLGKSRLVHAMKQHVRTNALPAKVSSPPRGAAKIQDPPVIEWRCSPHFQNTGLYPVSNFFQRILHFRRDESSSIQLDRLLEHLDRFGLARKEVVPLFASLLSLPLDDRFSSRGLTPSRERDELFLVLKEWLEAYSSHQPVLFVIEDLHWLDASTLEFLGQFLAEGAHDRILTILTFRPEFRTPWPALEHQTNLALNRLTKRQVAEMMRRKTSSDVPDALIDEIYDRSSGVPLFVEEFTQMADESGVLAQAGAGKKIKTLMARAIPATLQDLIMARLDRIEGDRELAQLASTLGREFSYELIAQVLNAEGQELESELSKLVKAEILYQKGRPPQCSYAFKHALLEDALYNTMIKTHRQQCHARIADVLESKFPKTVETQPEVAAHHFSEAGLADKSIRHWLAAGLKAQKRFANIEAISHFNRGLEQLNTMPESSPRDVHELSLLNPLGSAYQMALGYAAPQVGPTFARARELCERIDDKEQLFETMWGNWTWHLVGGNLELCLRLADEMMALAKNLGDKGMIMEAYVAPAVTHYYRGDFAGCRSYCDQAIAEFEDQEQCLMWSSKLGQHSGVVLRCYLAICLWHLGYPDRAQQTVNEMLALARRVAQPFSLAHALYFACWLYQLCRMGNELNTAAQEESALATDQGFALWQSTGTFHVGAALLLQGDQNRALEHLIRVDAAVLPQRDQNRALEQLKSGIQAFRAVAASLTLPAQLAVLAQGYIDAGQFPEAQSALDEGTERAEKTADQAFLSELWRLKGTLILSTSGDQSQAEGCFNKAIETARRQNSKSWELRGTISLARLWQQRGRTDAARKALANIYGAFQEGAATSDLQEAKALMTSLQ